MNPNSKSRKFCVLQSVDEKPEINQLRPGHGTVRRFCTWQERMYEIASPRDYPPELPPEYVPVSE